jgi:hypothetical protein
VFWAICTARRASLPPESSNTNSRSKT